MKYAILKYICSTLLRLQHLNSPVNCLFIMLHCVRDCAVKYFAPSQKFPRYFDIAGEIVFREPTGRRLAPVHTYKHSRRNRELQELPSWAAGGPKGDEGG